MNRYDNAAFILGDNDVNLNEDKNIKASKKLDEVITILTNIIKYSPLEECSNVEITNKLDKINELTKEIATQEINEVADMVAAVLTGVSGLVGVLGAKTVLKAWEQGNIIPTKLHNIMYDISSFANNKEKIKELKIGLKSRFPSASDETIDAMVKRAIEKGKA